MNKTLITICLTTALGFSMIVTGTAQAAQEEIGVIPIYYENVEIPESLNTSQIDFDNPENRANIGKTCASYIANSKTSVIEAYEAAVAAWEEEQARIAAEQARQAAAAKSYSGGSSIGGIGSNFKRDGVWYDDRYRYTYYSSRVLRHYRTSEWTPDANGIYRDKDGYAVVASNDHAQGTVVSGTPFGDAKVYDSGCASGTLDVYVDF